jgi:hypothetical protein
MSGSGHEATVMLEGIEERLRKALAVVGHRWSAINDGATCPAEEALYCEGFYDALRALFGSDEEADEIIEDLVARWADGPPPEPVSGGGELVPVAGGDAVA